jgi:phage recombination protein Bet
MSAQAVASAAVTPLGERHGRLTWAVASRTRPGVTYHVTRRPDGVFTCTCPAGAFRRTCHHRVAALGVHTGAVTEGKKMSVTAIASHRAPSPVPADWDTEEQRIIREQVAGGMNPPITDVELRYFASVCQARGLNPIAGQIVPVRRSGRMVIQVTIHGLRAIADATGCYAPGPLTTFETDADGSLVSATASVLKYAQGTWHCVSEVAYFDEYCEYTVDKHGERRGQALWGTKPRVMLAKCSEALALRRAFPVQLGGLYVDAELAQADTDEPGIPVSTPARTAPPSRPPAARTSAPAAPITAERLDFTSFWKAVREVGWDAEPIQAAALTAFGKPVANLTAAELAELRDAALSARLVADANGAWRIVPAGEPAALEEIDSAE